MADCYSSDTEYLEDELNRLDLLLRPMVLRFQAKGGISDPFLGLYISDQEAEGLLDGKVKGAEDGDIRYEINARIAVMAEEIEAKLARSQADIHLPRLLKCFSLNSFEKDALIICAAPELDAKYQRIYGYLQDDLTKTRPSLGLILEILRETQRERMQARDHFLPHCPLIKWRILRHSSERVSGPLISSSLQIDPGVLDYILGLDLPERGKCREEREAEMPLEYFADDELKCRMENLAKYLQGEGGICILEGQDGKGKRSAAQYICEKAGLGLSLIKLQDLLSEGQDYQNAILRQLRNARLSGSAAYLLGYDALSPEQREVIVAKGWLYQALQDFQGVSFLDADIPLTADLSRQNGYFKITVPLPNYQRRKEIWKSCLKGRSSLAGEELDKEIDSLANKFRFTSDQIQAAVSWANSQAILRGRKVIVSEDLHRGCRTVSKLNLSSLAVKVEPRYTWKSLVLPPDKIRQLVKMKNHIRYRGLVYQSWGFEERLSLGKGLNVIFSGPSGTGKTMAAEVIANDLELDLYKIDLSMVVSKYIGETEKNLNRIFKEAERIDAILFFDEADALFGKRSEVKDAHDRYANLEISYLLQKMEEHHGTVIMATNLSWNMDDAFMRRMHFIVEFPFPDEGSRLSIWKGLLPEKAPREESINFDFLAKKFKLSGGNIKNIMVNAAFLAAADSQQPSICMGHIIQATRDEMLKIGKVCNQSEFGEYKHLISN
jgi:ATP-dependent 26S proteasome regulatory subunit